MNTKSLFAHICEQMDKLSKNEITCDEAKTQTNLVKEAHKLLKYELERANTIVAVREFNLKTGATVELRQIEPKGFDDTTHQK